MVCVCVCVYVCVFVVVVVAVVAVAQAVFRLNHGAVTRWVCTFCLPLH